MKTKKTFISVISVFMAMLMVLVNLSLPVGALSDEIVADSTVKPIVKPEDKIDPVLKEKMETASPDEKIPVAIWYTDVDQKEIDKMTAQKVGYSKDDVAVDYEMPSQELLSDLKVGADDADYELQAYMARTEQQREKEHKRTDDYIMTRREFSRAMYNEKSASIINDLDINEEDIVFNSQYAPMIIAECSFADVISISRSEFVNCIEYYEYTEPIVNETEMDEETANKVKSAEYSIGYDNLVQQLEQVVNGEVIIGMFEQGGDVPDDSIYKDSSQFITVGSTYSQDHVRNTVSVLLEFAPNAIIYSAHKYNLQDVEALLNYNVKIINASCWLPYDNEDYSTYDKWVDHIVANHNVSVVASAGNYQQDRVLSPGMGHNVITVGFYDQLINNLNLNDITDDKMHPGSSYLNNDGVEKPDVVMPGNVEGGGTSSSAPVLTASIALLFNIKPSLSAYPQAVKAIVLASCHRKVTPANDGENVETMSQGITEKQGAGAPDVFTMASIVSQGTYGVGVISDIASQDVRRFVVPNANASNMNVSITWLKENTISNGLSHTNTSNVTTTADANLDLYVYRNNQLVGSSKIGSQSSTDNRISSTEMAYVSLSDNINDYYEIRIEKAEEYYESYVRYGYAYSTDVSYISQEEGEEGVYYIRNYYTNKYLTLSNNEAVMSNFTGADNQKWVVIGTTGNYELMPAYATAGTKINFGNQIGSTAFYKAVTGTSDLDLSISTWETDGYFEPDTYVFTTTSGGSQNILGYSSSYGAFARSASAPAVNMLRMWMLEDINYRVGDVNVDGVINYSDSDEVQNYVGGDITFNNLQYYLADFNNDGTVNVRDASAIQRYILSLS